ncbi:MAG TPA: FAD-binding oxidoreductase [Candidatus Sulfotelmatobacter sp.]|nr:FAD-binding oxidoreductase [Candidatus Sulfotelmatobacter sp.]
MSTQDCDFLIVGAGIAGASAGYNLAARGRVVILERESQPGYHTTGRSAAFYSETYGNAVIRALTTGSRDFYTNPPAGFTDQPLLLPLGAIYIASEEQKPALDKLFADGSRLVDSLRMLGRDEILARVPVVRPEFAAAGMLEPESRSIDVHALHQGFLRGLRRRGGTVVTDAEVTKAVRQDERWLVTTPAGEFTAPVLVNAAGAWCDVLAGIAGARPVGLVPKRRTAIIFAPPPGVDITGWPIVSDTDEKFYFKADAGKFLASPADETPMEPCDVQPDELDVAICVDRIESATTMRVARVERKWAGLRSFVADKTIVAGFDPDLAGFFWLAGQGGYGIQTAPAMGRVVAALASHQDLPADIRALGISAADLSPARFRR